MKSLTTLILSLWVISCPLFGMDRSTLLQELDDKVKNRQFYMQKKESRIDSLKIVASYLPPENRYPVFKEIYNEYSTYRNDSAMQYVYLNLELADKLKNPVYKDEMKIALSFLLSTTGLYQESMENLHSVNRKTIDASLLPIYYYVSEWTHYIAGAYTNDTLYAPQYQRQEQLYRDSLFSILNEETPEYQYYKGRHYQQKGDLQEAMTIFQNLYPTIPIDTRLYAIVTFDLANVYNALGDKDNYEKYLILAAISDQVCPLKENLAMQDLALYLYTHKPEDLNRAFRYIQCSMEDARFYNNRLRMVQISEKLPIIVNAYQLKSAKEKRNLTISLIAISLLSFVTLILLVYIFRQVNIVKRSRKELHLLNKELNSLNKKLQSANQTKEEYVGLFMDLCSSYIDKLDKFRETVKRKIIAKQIDDLYKISNSTRTIETELDKFFENFDRAFLTLYPSFVDEFNKLLIEDGQIKPKKEELLNVELRIFALIRLGIKDSAKIATFLRYSPQTIYNYRAKVKNKSSIDRERFENEVMKIGKHFR